MMTTLEKIVSLAKRRGFVYPSSEIYGGLSGFYDWGHLGNELLFNIEQLWWEDMVKSRDDVVAVRAATIMNPKVWKASGHLETFSDSFVECKGCNLRYRLDELGIDFSPVTKDALKVKESGRRQARAGALKVTREIDKIKCPNCGKKNWSLPKQFNLMFKTFVGPTEEAAAVAYLRPETAGGIFVNFKNIMETNRLKIPFGIAQIGLAWRNEINPRDFVFRLREFKQMELEYFVRPEEADKSFKEWVKRRLDWYKKIGLKNVKPREQKPEERAHYSKATVDIEYKFPFGTGEIEGIANRGDFDLQAHMKASGVDLSYFDEETKKRYLPYVIEPSAGVERIALALFCDAYFEEKDRVVLRLHPRLAPYKAAVFPLLANKPKLVKLAREVFLHLKSNFPYPVGWDDRGNIGKRYYSQDEIGTPWCITVDFESLEHNDVTVRSRDTMKQKRVKIKELISYLKEKL